MPIVFFRFIFNATFGLFARRVSYMIRYIYLELFHASKEFQCKDRGLIFRVKLNSHSGHALRSTTKLLSEMNVPLTMVVVTINMCRRP